MGQWKYSKAEVQTDMLWENQNKSWLLFGFITFLMNLLIFVFAVFLMTPTMLVEYVNGMGISLLQNPTI
jgi:hypothetical protein